MLRALIHPQVSYGGLRRRPAVFAPSFHLNIRGKSIIFLSAIE
jgi:hypothetical protein